MPDDVVRSDRLDRILALARAHRPGLRLVDKADSAWMRVAAVGMRPFMPTFLTQVTTVIGDTVYTPGPPETIPRALLARILAHELVHQLDQAERPVWFYVSYGLVLPTWRTWRAHWERRAYGVDLMLAWEEGGEGALGRSLARIEGLFAGPAYGWMWGGRRAARAYLAPVAEAVRRGALQQTEPYRSVLEAWRG
jgi:hypothetical protein